MCCINKILCFIGIHKWKKVNRLSKPYRVSRKRKVYYEMEQCQRCCNIRKIGEPIDKSLTTKATDKSNIKSCSL